MLRFLLLTTLLAFAAADHHELFHKFAIKKIMQSCMGAEVFKNEFKKFCTYYDECKNETNTVQVAAGTRRARDHHHEEKAAAASEVPQPEPDIVNKQVSEPETVVAVNEVPAIKDKVIFPEETIRDLKNKMKKKKQMARCILKKYGMIDNNDSLQLSAVKKHYNSLPIEDVELKHDLLNIADQCYKFSNCAPFVLKGGMSEGLRRSMAYCKCEKKMKLKACIKKDLRKMTHEFELSGLDGVLDDLDKDEQMLKVLNAHVKVGDDPMDVFDF